MRVNTRHINSTRSTISSVVVLVFRALISSLLYWLILPVYDTWDELLIPSPDFNSACWRHVRWPARSTNLLLIATVTSHGWWFYHLTVSWEGCRRKPTSPKWDLQLVDHSLGSRNRNSVAKTSASALEPNSDGTSFRERVLGRYTGADSALEPIHEKASVHGSDWAASALTGICEKVEQSWSL